jgi:hypothetical protein
MTNYFDLNLKCITSDFKVMGTRVVQKTKQTVPETIEEIVIKTYNKILAQSGVVGEN